MPILTDTGVVLQFTRSTHSTAFEALSLKPPQPQPTRPFPSTRTLFFYTAGIDPDAQLSAYVSLPMTPHTGCEICVEANLLTGH